MEAHRSQIKCKESRKCKVSLLIMEIIKTIGLQKMRLMIIIININNLINMNMETKEVGIITMKIIMKKVMDHNSEMILIIFIIDKEDIKKTNIKRETTKVAISK